MACANPHSPSTPQNFYGWVGDDSMLTEMREALASVNDYPTFTKIVLDLGEKALARLSNSLLGVQQDSL